MSLLQPDNVVNIGLQIGTIPSDELVSTYESYNPDYSSTVVKQGTNPIPPENSVVLSKEVDTITGIITIVCGIRHIGTPGRPQGSRPEEQVQVTSAGVFSAAGQAKQLARRLETDNSGAISDLTYQTVTNVRPESALDTARAQGLEAATIVALLPGQGSVRGFAGAPVNPEDSGKLIPSIAMDAPGTLDTMMSGMTMWIFLIGILIAVMIGGLWMNKKHGWVDLSALGLGALSDDGTRQEAS